MKGRFKISMWYVEGSFEEIIQLQVYVNVCMNLEGRGYFDYHEIGFVAVASKHLPEP